MAKTKKLIVPEMRKQLPDADLAKIEQFQARMQILLGEAQDQPTLNEYRAFDAVLATAHASVLGGGPAVVPVEERLTQAEWEAKKAGIDAAKPDEAPAPPEAATEAPPAPAEPEQPPAPEPKTEKKAGKRPFDRKQK